MNLFTVGCHKPARCRVPGMLLLLTGAMVLTLVQGAAATSLWGDGAGSLFTDAKAHEVGDLLTLVIVEQTEASSTATTSTGKDSDIRLGPFMGLMPQLPAVSAGSSDDMRASGTTTRRGSLRAQMTVRVVEKLPGDNLRVEGRQTIIVNGEEQELIVAGVVRTRDIEPDNSVLSTHLADASISYTGVGALGDAQEPGLLTRILRLIF